MIIEKASNSLLNAITRHLWIAGPHLIPLPRATSDDRKDGLPDCELSAIADCDTLRWQAEGAGLPDQRHASCRMIAMFVNPENLLLLRLAVYPPTSIEGYHQKLRLPFEIRRRHG